MTNTIQLVVVYSLTIGKTKRNMTNSWNKDTIMKIDETHGEKQLKNNTWESNDKVMKICGETWWNVARTVSKLLQTDEIQETEARMMTRIRRTCCRRRWKSRRSLGCRVRRSRRTSVRRRRRRRRWRGNPWDWPWRPLESPGTARWGPGPWLKLDKLIIFKGKRETFNISLKLLEFS